MKKYTTKNKVDKLQTRKILAIVLVVIGLFLLLIDGIPTSFQEFFDSLTGLAFIPLGLIYFFNISTSIKKIENDYITIGNQSLTLYQNETEYTFSSEAKPISIVQKLKSIEITSSKNEAIRIDLENYLLEFSEKQEMKASIKKLIEYFKD